MGRCALHPELVFWRQSDVYLRLALASAFGHDGVELVKNAAGGVQLLLVNESRYIRN